MKRSISICLLVLLSMTSAFAKGPSMSKGGMSRGGQSSFSKGPSMSRGASMSKGPSMSRGSSMNRGPSVSRGFSPSSNRSPSRGPVNVGRQPSFSSSRPNISKPSIGRPSIGNSGRLPSVGKITRPSNNLNPGKGNFGKSPINVSPSKPIVSRPVAPGFGKSPITKGPITKNPVKPNPNTGRPSRPNPPAQIADPTNEGNRLPGKGKGVLKPMDPPKFGVIKPELPKFTPAPKPNPIHIPGRLPGRRPIKIGHKFPPICLPPIVKCPPPRVCPPCVLAICPQAQCIIVEQTTEVIIAEFLGELETEPAFVIDLQVDTEVTLEVDGLDGTPGTLVLDVNGIGLPIEILGAEEGLVNIKVPSVGLTEAQLGKLYVLNADQQLVAAIDARLHPAAQ